MWTFKAVWRINEVGEYPSIVIWYDCTNVYVVRTGIRSLNGKFGSFHLKTIKIKTYLLTDMDVWLIMPCWNGLGKEPWWLSLTSFQYWSFEMLKTEQCIFLKNPLSCFWDLKLKIAVYEYEHIFCVSELKAFFLFSFRELISVSENLLEHGHLPVQCLYAHLHTDVTVELHGMWKEILLLCGWH